ncbi:molybdopterin-dependent oxidoreductase [Dehalogenimonas sp. THU2]|uniref:molybdopterin-dependent oxidoreductase n=1 Tax=Dehalogenimonas sp. THU2 TaxID=3151121 RepID=UPI0032185A2C
MRTWLRKLKPLIIVATTLALLMAIAGGCTPKEATPTVDDSPLVLTLVNGTQTKELTFNQLKALSAKDGQAGLMNSTGRIIAPQGFKGVSIADLLSQIGGITEANAVRVEAKDGYTMTLSHRQITEGYFTAFDVASGNELSNPPPLIPIIAYEQSGNEIPDSDGPLRMVILANDTTVTEGHWWVKWVTKIEIIEAAATWTLMLEGGITEEMDYATFESGATPGCHGAEWTDPDGNVWQGIPLWRLLGWVDDGQKHQRDIAFNDDLANAGYQIQVTASDGFSRTISSELVKRNDKIIVAFKMNGEMLSEAFFPLRLVGEGLTKGQMVSLIVSIKIIFP